MLALEVALQLATNLRPRPMEKHSLIGLRELESVTAPFGAPPLDVAQRDHGTLRRGQALDRVGDDAAELAREQGRLRERPRCRLAPGRQSD